MKTIKQILKEELSKRDQLRAKVRELYRENLSLGIGFPRHIINTGFEYEGMLQDCQKWAQEWAEEGIARSKGIIPQSNVQRWFIRVLSQTTVKVGFNAGTIRFYKDGIVIFEIRHKVFWITDDSIVKVIMGEYSISEEEINGVFLPIVNEAFNARLRAVETLQG